MHFDLLLCTKFQFDIITFLVERAKRGLEILPQSICFKLCMAECYMYEGQDEVTKTDSNSFENYFYKKNFHFLHQTIGNSKN